MRTLMKTASIFILTIISVSGLSSDAKRHVEKKYHESCGLPPWVGKKSYKNKDPKSFSAYWYKGNSWKAGQTINVYFVNGTKEQKAITKFYALEWARYGNFQFNFKKGPKTTNEEAVVIKFTKELSKKGICGTSNVGSGSTKMKYPSVHLDCVSAGTIIHEFGHILGFNHEQDNPSGEHQYNMEEYYKYYKAKGYSKAELDKWRKAYRNTDYYDWSAFDRYSVMAYSLPGKLFQDGRAFGGKDHLSQGDKEAIQRIFPGKPFPKDSLNNYVYFGKGKMKVDVSLKRAEASIYVNNKLVKTLKDPEDSSYGLRTEVSINSHLKPGYGKNVIRIESKRKDANSEVFFWFMEKSESPKFYRGYESFSCFGQKQCGWDPSSLNHNIAFNFYKLNPEDYYTKSGNKRENPDNPVKPPVTTIKNASKWSGSYVCEEDDVLKIQAKKDGSISGTFSNGRGTVSGKISLERQNLLQGKWSMGSSDKDRGFFYFYLQSNGKLKGQWAYIKDKKWRSSWNCTKGNKSDIQDERKKEILKKIKEWARNYDCGEDSGPLKLKIQNISRKQLSGTFGVKNNGILSGTLEGDNLNEFKGEWYYPGGSKGDFIFYRRDGKLVGYWKYSNETEWKKDDWTCQ